MKRISKVLLALSFLIPSLAFAQSYTNQIPGTQQAQSVILTAPGQNRADSTAGTQLADREGNTKATLGHAEYTEPCRRGKCFSTANLGFTIVAANANKGAIGTFAPILGFYNPLGSGVNAVIYSAQEWSTSGTSGGPLIWDFFCGVNWNSATPASWTIYNRLLSNTFSGSAMILQTNTAVTTNPAITTAMNQLEPLGGPDTTALGAGGEAGHYQDLKGQIVVPPGCLLGLSSTATGTSQVVNASMSWEEVAQ